jgi:hypothetical protein
MRLSKNQLDHLQQSARFPMGRTAGRDPAAREEAVAARADERSDRAIEDVIRATEEVVRAADDVIRAAQDAAPVPPLEVLEPEDPDILPATSTSPRQVVQLPPLMPARRSRISLAVALLLLAFGAGAAMSWLLFGEPSRARDQVWNLVSLALGTGRGIPPIPAMLDPPSRHASITPPSSHGTPNATPAAVVARPAAPSGGAANETAETAPRPVPAADVGRPRVFVPPPASVSMVGTVPAKVAAPPSPGSVGIASGEPSAAGAVPSPGAGIGVLESNPTAPNAPRPGERSLSGIVLGALPGGHPRTPDKMTPDPSPGPVASPGSAPASTATQAAVSQAPVTQAPVTQAPVAQPPVAQMPVAAVPVAPVPVIPGPATPGPAAQVPTAEVPESLTACLAARPASLRLAHEETARLLKRGEEFMGEGRVSAARLMFQRAAEACDVRAAFALGASYDPIMLQKLGVALLDPDVGAARSWYQKAKELGSSEASQELELLSNWHQ